MGQRIDTYTITPAEVAATINDNYTNAVAVNFDVSYYGVAGSVILTVQR